MILLIIPGVNHVIHLILQANTDTDKTFDVIVRSAGNYVRAHQYDYDTGVWSRLVHMSSGSAIPSMNSIGNAVACRSSRGSDYSRVGSIEYEVLPVQYSTKLDINRNFHLVEGDASFNNALNIGGTLNASGRTTLSFGNYYHCYKRCVTEIH